MKTNRLLILSMASMMLLAACGNKGEDKTQTESEQSEPSTSQTSEVTSDVTSEPSSEQPSSEQPSSEQPSSSEGVEHDGKSVATAYTADEAIAAMKAWNSTATEIRAEDWYVKGVAENSTYDSKHSSYTVYLSGDPDDLQLYSAQLDASIKGNYQAENAFEGKTVVAKGWPQVYFDKSGNKKYEIAYVSAAKSPTGEANSPTILSVSGDGEGGQSSSEGSSSEGSGTISLEGTATTFDFKNGKNADSGNAQKAVWTDGAITIQMDKANSESDFTEAAYNGQMRLFAGALLTVSVSSGSLKGIEVFLNDLPSGKDKYIAGIEGATITGGNAAQKVEELHYTIQATASPLILTSSKQIRIDKMNVYVA